MNNEIIVALLACLGTAAGSLGGIVAASKMTTFRLQQLEKKVDEHNNVIKRTFVLEEQMKVANHRINDLEEGAKR